MPQTITFEVEMLAFDPGRIRRVDVPVEALPDAEEASSSWPRYREAILDQVFKYGQNDFQPKPFPSLSVGDVIRAFGGRWVIAPVGFEQAEAKVELADIPGFGRRRKDEDRCLTDAEACAIPDELL